MYERLFSGDSIRSLFEAQQTKALAELAAIPTHELRQRTLDELASECAKPWRLEPVVLSWDDKKVSLNDADDQAASEPHGGNATAVTITLVVPFKGAATGALLRTKPRARLRKAPAGFVWQSQACLLLRHVGTSRDTAAVVDRDFNRQEATVRQYVEAINHDLDAFNAELQTAIRRALQLRLDRLQSMDDLAVSLGIERAGFEIPKVGVATGGQRARPLQRNRAAKVNDTKPGGVDTRRETPADRVAARAAPTAGRPPGTRYLTRAAVIAAKDAVEADAAAGLLRTRGRVRKYATLDDLVERLDSTLGTLKDFLRAEGLSWRTRDSWPVE